MKRVMMIVLCIVLIFSVSVVYAGSIGMVSDTQGSTRNVGTISCDKNCSINFRADKIVCSNEYKESKSLCKTQYKNCKNEAKLLRWINRSEYSLAKVECRDNYKACITQVNANRTNCKDEATSDFNECRMNCRIEKNICLNNSYCSQGKFCSFNSCDSVQGTCIQIPEVCTEEFAPVCACNNQTYSNLCNMQMNNQSLRNTGECLVV